MLIFEKGKEGGGLSLLPECDVEVVLPEEKDRREEKNFTFPNYRKMNLADITQNWRRSVMESMTGSIHLAPVQ